MTIQGPRYTLARVRQLVVLQRFRITNTATRGAGELGLDLPDILACVANLSNGDFYKSMHAKHAPGLWQDVYRPIFRDTALYVKIQIVGSSPDDLTVVISFKRL